MLCDRSRSSEHYSSNFPRFSIGIILFSCRAGMITSTYEGTGVTMVTDLQCTGLESDVSMCSSRLARCPSGQAVHIDCSKFLAAYLHTVLVAFCL